MAHPRPDLDRSVTVNHPRAGQPAQAEDLVDVTALVDAYYDRVPDASNPDQMVV